MKRIAIIMLMMLISAGYLSAQSAYEKMKSYYTGQDYELAAANIAEAVRANPKDIDVYILAGDIYFELEKPDSALYFYRKADDIKSKQTPVLRRIGRTLTAIGDYPEAIKILKRAIELDEKDAYNLLELGHTYIKADSLRPAELIITKARELNKKIPDAYIALGDLYFAQKVYELARTNYEEALSINDNLTDARVKLATVYYWLANREMDDNLSQELFQRSLKEWNIVTQKDPKNAKAFFEQGKILYLAKRWVESAQSFYQYIKLRPSGSLGRWYLAQCLFEVGKCDSAAPQLKIVSQEIDSVKDKATLKLAQCYFEQKMFNEAITIYKDLHSKNKLDNTDLERLAAATFRTGDTTSAIGLYKELVAKDKSKCQTMFQLGSLTLFMKKYDEAIYFFTQHSENCKDSVTTPKALYYVGYCYFYTSKPDSALLFLNKSLKTDKNYLASEILIADIYASLKQADTAQTIFENVIAKGKADTARFSRDLSTAFQKLNYMLIQEKNYKDLMKFSKQWSEYDPNSEWAWLFVAIAYQSQNDVENAKKAYRKVLAINPKNPTAKDNLKKLESMQQN